MPGSMVSSRRATGQLGRILLSGSSGPPDEQSAVSEDSGSYGELMDEIDRLIEGTEVKEPDRRDS